MADRAEIATPGITPENLIPADDRPPVPLDQIIMKAYDGIFAPSYRYPPYQPDRLTTQKGFALADDMLNMGACRAPFNLLRYSLLADGWEVESAVADPKDARAVEAQKYADFHQYTFDNIQDAEVETDFRTVLFETARGCWEGFRVQEIGWKWIEEGDYANRNGFSGFFSKPCKQIGFDVDPRTMLPRHITSYTPSGGYDFSVPISRCVLYTFDPQDSQPWGRGLWRSAYKHWFQLDNIQRFWAMALERWGAPTFLAEVSTSGSSSGGNGGQGDYDEVAEALEKIRQGGPAVVPDSGKYTLLTVPSTVFQSFKDAADWNTQQIGLTIIGSVLTQTEGQHGGNRALGGVHENTSGTVYDHIAHDIESVYRRQVIKRSMRYNFPKADMTLAPNLRLRKKSVEDLLQKAQAAKIAIEAGVASPRAGFMRAEFGYPPMDAEEEKILDAEKAAQDEAQKQMADARNSGKVAKMSEHTAEACINYLAEALVAQARIKEVAAA